MKNFSKGLASAWLVSAVVDLIAYFTLGFDIDKLLLAGCALCLAYFNYKDYKRGE